VRDESIVLGNGNVIGGIGKEKESGTGTRNETQGERASIVETGIDTTVARGSIDEETTNGAVRLLPQTDPLLSRMDVHRHFCHLKRLTLTGKKARYHRARPQHHPLELLQNECRQNHRR
jgi:hypothetical protein